jgi:hypothetical protein
VHPLQERNVSARVEEAHTNRLISLAGGVNPNHTLQFIPVRRGRSYYMRVRHNDSRSRVVRTDWQREPRPIAVASRNVVDGWSYVLDNSGQVGQLERRAHQAPHQSGPERPGEWHTHALRPVTRRAANSRYRQPRSHATNPASVRFAAYGYSQPSAMQAGQQSSSVSLELRDLAAHPLIEAAQVEPTRIGDRRASGAAFADQLEDYASVSQFDDHDDLAASP